MQENQLKEFFHQWGALATRKPPKTAIPLEQRLPEFFDAFSTTGLGAGSLARKDLPHHLTDTNKLASWFEVMQQPLEDARRSVIQCNPWKIAGLKRNEVRNSRVLAWLLDPFGTHGRGSVFLDTLLTITRQQNPALLTCAATGRWRVHTEATQFGDRGNRVDILLSCDSIYLVVEVKIGASEGDNQLDRYAELASARCGARQWAIVFLTPQGKMSTTHDAWGEKIAALSWAKLAGALSEALKADDLSRTLHPEELIATFLVQTYLDHVRKF